MSTLANVAEKAGVSISTVSQILNNRDMRRFPPETRERVRQAAEELRYRRSRSMSRRWQNASFTNTVSFVIGSPISWTESNRTPFYAEMTDGIQQEAHNHGFSLNLAAGLKTAREKIDYLRRVSDKGSVDGFLLASNIEPEVRSFLLENDLQAVFLGDHPLPVKDFGCVHGDNIQGGYLATQHLLNLGHRRIVFVGRCSALEFYRLRMTGYCRALVESGITADPLLICDYRIETGVKEELDRVFSLAQSPTAIFAGCHATALLVLEYLQERGITAPEEASIVAYDNLSLQEYTQPPLTCINVSQEAIGRLGFRQLIRILMDGDGARETTLVPAELVVRASTAPPRDKRRAKNI